MERESSQRFNTMKPRQDTKFPSLYYCHKCCKKHETKAFTCSCGFVRTGHERLRLEDREMIQLAWKRGRDEAWISSRFNVSNKQARAWLPISLKKKRLRVM